MKTVDDIINELRAYKRSRIITTAIHLGVLDALGDEKQPKTTEAIVKLLSIAPNWLTTILNVLCDCDLVALHNDAYHLTQLGLDANQNVALRAFAGYHFHCYEAWAGLPEAMSSGEGMDFHRQRIQNQEFCRAYLYSMAAIADAKLDFIRMECDPYLYGNILDIGAGPASLCRALAAADSTRFVTALDYEEIATQARCLYGESDNFRWLSGDFLTIPRDQQFDSIYCGHLFEYCPKNELQHWLLKIQQLLKPGGHFVLLAFLRESGQPDMQHLNIFEVSTGLHGPRLGTLCSLEEMKHCLAESGFMVVLNKTAPRGPSYPEHLIISQHNITE